MADCRPRWRKENLIYCPVLVDHYKDSIEQWSKKEDRLGYAVDQLGIEGEENEENLKQLMDELRAD